jgi:hypothetical protein
MSRAEYLLRGIGNVVRGFHGAAYCTPCQWQSASVDDAIRDVMTDILLTTMPAPAAPASGSRLCRQDGSYRRRL